MHDGVHDEKGPERDWCIVIAPERGFEFVHDDVAVPMGRSDRHSLIRDGGRSCVECEITPDENYYDSRQSRSTRRARPA